MRVILLLSAAALAACAEEPRAPLGANARAQCEAAGLAPGQPQFAECVTRLMTAAVEAFNRPAPRAAPVALPQFQPVVNPWTQIQTPRLQTTCTRWGNQTVCQ